jgi:hypothetical protein
MACASLKLLYNNSKKIILLPRAISTSLYESWTFSALVRPKTRIVRNSALKGDFICRCSETELPVYLLDSKQTVELFTSFIRIWHSEILFRTKELFGLAFA